MKKIALVLAVLLVLSGAAFAEVTGGEPSFTGYVKTTIGYDLEGAFWGIDGSNSITLTIPLATGGDSLSGDDDLYGEITLTDVAVNIKDLDFDTDDNDKGTISAYIYAGDIFIGLNEASFNFNNADGTGTWDVNLDNDWYTPDSDGNYLIGFDNDTIMAALKFAAKGGITRADAGDANEDFLSWWDGDTAESDPTTADQNTGNGFLIGVDFSFTSDAFTLPVYTTFDLDYNYTDVMLVGVSAAPSIVAGPLTIDLPVDFVLVDADYGLDVAPSIAIAAVDGLDITLAAYYYMTSIASVANDYVKASVTIGVGMVDNLTAEVGVALKDLTGTLAYDVYLDAAYVLADGLTLSLVPGYDGGFYLDAGLEMAAAFTGIDNTTISLNYNDFYAGDDNGVISLCTKVSF